MVTAMNYFKTTGATAPIQAPCQKNFVVIVTDGLPTQRHELPDLHPRRQPRRLLPGRRGVLHVPERHAHRHVRHPERDHLHDRVQRGCSVAPGNGHARRYSRRIVSETSRVDSRRRALAVRPVTSRYRLPFDRTIEPIVGSSGTTVSGESGRRSCSATKPSFIWSRTAKSGPRLRSGGLDGPGAPRLAGRGLGVGLATPRRLAGLPDYTRRTRTRSPAAENPPGAVRKAPRSSPVRSRSSCADDRLVGLDEQGVALDRRPAGRRRSPPAPVPRRGHPRSTRRAPAAAPPRDPARELRPAAGRRCAPSGAAASSWDRRRLTRAHERRAVRARFDRPARAGRPQGRVEVSERRRRHERLGQLGDRPDEVGASLWIELAEDVVEEEQRRSTVEAREDLELGQLQRQDRRPLLAARGEPGEVATLELEDEVVAVRSDERRPVPGLLVGRLGQPPGQRVADRLARSPRRVRLVAGSSGGPRPGRSRHAPGGAARPIAWSVASRPSTTALPASSRVPSQ